MINFIEIGLLPIKFETLISTVKSLGYSKIGLNTKEFSTDVDIVNRLDLNPRNPNELLRKLSSSRWKVEIITVNCRSKSLARLVGRDRRVDLITYPLLSNWKYNHLDRKQIFRFSSKMIYIYLERLSSYLKEIQITR
jgi:RNase P/RNase MRP subunit p30